MKTNQFHLAFSIALALTLTAALGRTDTGPRPIEEPPKAEKFSGTLRTLDADKRVMTVEVTPIRKTFGIAPDCEVVTKTKPKASLEDLTVGSLVDVTYLDSNGELIAQRIEVEGPPQQARLLLPRAYALWRAVRQRIPSREPAP